MPLVNKCKQLPDELREAVNEAFSRGISIDDVTAAIQAQGEEISRSSVGRYRRQWEDMVHDVQEARDFADYFITELSHMPENKLSRMNIQLLESGIFRLLNEVRKLESKDDIDVIEWAKLYERITKSVRSLSGATVNEISSTIVANDYAIDIEIGSEDDNVKTEIDIKFNEG